MIFIQENVFCDVCKMSVILCRPQCHKMSNRISGEVSWIIQRDILLEIFHSRKSHSFKQKSHKNCVCYFVPGCASVDTSLDIDCCQYTEVDILQTFSNACSMWWPSLHPVCIWYHHLKSNIGIYRCQRPLQQTVYLTLSYEWIIAFTVLIKCHRSKGMSD